MKIHTGMQSNLRPILRFAIKNDFISINKKYIATKLCRPIWQVLNKHQARIYELLRYRSVVRLLFVEVKYRCDIKKRLNAVCSDTYSSVTKKNRLTSFTTNSKAVYDAVEVKCEIVSVSWGDRYQKMV